MSLHLTTDVELAERFGLELEEFHKLRTYHRWPCVKLGRSKWRFTDAQVEQIVAAQTRTADRPAKVPGQTSRSASRGKRSA